MLTNDGPSYPPLLGTGGNDGRLEFTNNFMQRAVELIDPDSGEATPRSRELLEGSLFDVASHDRLRRALGKKRIGQFSPGAAGGANAAADFDGDAVTNPWDYVLMLEGALVLSGSVARRREESGRQTLSYPFAVRTTDAGYRTAARGDLENSRHETWLPLWDRPASFPELSALFSEGRASVGRRQARDAVDFARAIGALGVDRGLSAFERFGYLQRNGQAYVAVPLERWNVPDRPSARIGLLDELDEWLDRFRRVARDDNTPASMGRALRRMEGATLEFCRHDLPVRWQALLAALGAAEEAMVRSPGTTVNRRLSPLPSLSTDWLRACDDGSPDYRLALSLASIRAADELGPLRANMVPLADWRRWPRFNTKRMDQPFVVWGHADLVSNMTATLMRRCMEAKRIGLDALPLRGTRPARLDDIGAFIYGEVDDEKLEGLLWGLNAVWLDREWTPPDRRGVLPASYSLLKLANLPHPLERLPGTRPIPIRHDPEISRLASAGRMNEAVDRAVQRLRASGLPIATGGMPETPQMSRRIAAALLFPVSQEAIVRLCDHVLLPQEQEAV